MKLIIVVACALLALTAAAPSEPAPVEVVVLETSRTPEGSYKLKLETSNGAKREETGELKEVLNEENKPVKVIVVQGSYTTTDNEGNPHTINFVADENGFKADGDIPKAPEPSRR